jgi:hypothetical protein
MLNGINPKTLLNTPEEWHALVIGFCEVLCPWPPRHVGADTPPACIKGEEHYYMAGRALGFPLLILIIIALVKLVLEVLL